MLTIGNYKKTKVCAFIKKQKYARLWAEANLKHLTSDFLPQNESIEKVNEKTHADENVVTKRKLDENSVYNAADSTAVAKKTKVDKWFSNFCDAKMLQILSEELENCKSKMNSQFASSLCKQFGENNWEIVDIVARERNKIVTKNLDEMKNLIEARMVETTPKS